MNYHGEVKTGHAKAITCLCIKNDNPDIMVSGSNDHSVVVSKVKGFEITGEKTLLGHTDIVTDVDLSKDGKYVISSPYDKTLRLWNIEKGECR
eukprot:UN04249